MPAPDNQDGHARETAAVRSPGAPGVARRARHAGPGIRPGPRDP